MTPKRVLFVPDAHRPYHDKRAWGIMLRAAKALRPEIICVLGDFADFYSVSSHDKDPQRVRFLAREVEDAIDGLRDLTALGAKRKIFVCGNHENRLERYLRTRSPELFESMAVEDLFELKARKWEFVPYRSAARIGKLWVTHDVGHAGKHALYQSQAAFEDNLIIGHTHRMGMIVVGNAKGVPHVAASFGWLGDKSKIDYMHSVKVHRDWAHGFGIGYLLPDGCVHVVPTPIVKGRCIVEGKVIR